MPGLIAGLAVRIEGEQPARGIVIALPDLFIFRYHAYSMFVTSDSFRTLSYPNCLTHPSTNPPCTEHVLYVWCRPPSQLLASLPLFSILTTWPGSMDSM